MNLSTSDKLKHSAARGKHGMNALATDQDRQHVAVHEAAHAVLFHRLGFNVVRVQVAPSPRVDFVTSGRDTDEHHHIVGTMAGKIGEDELLGKVTIANDWDERWLSGRYAFDSALDGELRGVARRLVRRYASDIRLVASALLANSVLDAAAFRRLLG